MLVEDDLHADEDRNANSDALMALPKCTGNVAHAARQRTYQAYKSLPKHPDDRTDVVCRLMRRCFMSPSTKTQFSERMHAFLPAQPAEPVQPCYTTQAVPAKLRRRNSIGNIPSADCVQKQLRKIACLRQKKDFTKIHGIMAPLLQKLTYANIAQMGGMAYSTLWWMTHKPKSNAKRYVTPADKAEIASLYVRSDIALQLGWKKYCTKWYVRTRLEDVVATYQEERREAGKRVWKRSTILKYRPKNVKCMGKTPYKECQCDDCVNYRLLQDAALAAQVKGISRRPTTNVLASLCGSTTVDSDAVSDAADDPQFPVDSNVCEATADSDAVSDAGDDPQFPVDSDSDMDPWDSDCEEEPDSADSPPPPPPPPSAPAVAGPSSPPNPTVTSRCADIIDFPRNCIFRNCTACGLWKLLNMILECNQDLDFEKQVFWHTWRNVKEDGYTAFSKVRCRGTVLELIHLFATKTMKMSWHLFNRFWQNKKFKQCRANMKEGDVCMVMDFGQNIAHKVQDEPQSAHWSRKNTTVHPVVCYHRCPEQNCNELVIEELIMLSSDTKHDIHQVFSFENKAITYLYANSLIIQRVFQFSDNCSGQYKSCFAFETIAGRDFPIQRNYFGAKHGKGVADGAIGRLQRDLTNHTRSDQVEVMNAHDLFVYASTALTTPPPVPGVCKHTRRHFFLVETDRSFALNAITYAGTQQLHCVRNTGVPGCLDVRLSSCFCRYKLQQ